MMNFLFYMGLCIFLIVLQTTFIDYLAIFDKMYDLLLPFVLYLGLYRPPREGLPTALLLGLVMDGVSGTPFGLYTTTYIWIYAIVNWGFRFLQVGNLLLLFIIIAAGVLLENLVFLASVTILSRRFDLPPGAMDHVATQVLWGMATGPMLLMAVRYSHGGFESWFGKRLTEWKERNA